MARFVLVASLFVLAACGKKDAPAESGAESAKAGSLSNANVPKDKASMDFATALTTNVVSNFKPMDNGEMKFVYKTLTFRTDNSWQAEVVMGEGEDALECKELGSWTMDPAESAQTAQMEWTLNKTTCAGRPPNNIMRTKVTIRDGDYTIMFR